MTRLIVGLLFAVACWGQNPLARVLRTLDGCWEMTCERGDCSEPTKLPCGRASSLSPDKSLDLGSAEKRLISPDKMWWSGLADGALISPGPGTYNLGTQQVYWVYENGAYVGRPLAPGETVQRIPLNVQGYGFLYAAQAAPLVTATGLDICGTNIERPVEFPEADLLQVSCADMDAILAIVPGFPGSGKWTQAVVHAKAGDLVCVTLRNQIGCAKVSPDDLGRRVGMVQFPGFGYTEIQAIETFNRNK